ncbi:EamA family transporter [Nocardioides marmoribigeumensis]|uniref:Drug/metabolite transporter (DMT)-like permease n=1 Tax=Nocardioides marmoribigeumensis TaxID=433649 RepID=A0ABU2BV21_9ACTN|nr:EamA family transporter [Nocardioides marmoribigeumensis]MDR7362487.1 drug/metabolite transporter (DMT)-like permease [Nocardioides marmoribigeumensis]
MSTLTHDEVTLPAPSALSRGLGLAVVSAASFALSGPLATGLIRTGWTPGSVVLLRVALAALALAPLGVRAMRGRWAVLRASWRLVTAYGVLAVAGAQLCYFSAVARMDVGPALLIEYTAPAAVVLFLWAAHGERPGRLTVAGAVIAAAGLVLVLDLLSGASLDPVGVLWALGAMVGAASYFVINGHDGLDLPPLALATAGLVVGAVVLGLAGLVGALPMGASTAAADYRGVEVAWWLPVLALGLVTASLAYASGVAAGRLLGSRLSSFVALLEVLCAVLFAWLLLGQLPGAVQLGGGALVLAGVVLVKLGEGPTAAPAPPVLPAATV